MSVTPKRPISTNSGCALKTHAAMLPSTRNAVFPVTANMPISTALAMTAKRLLAR